jgi:hypothetical protein
VPRYVTEITTPLSAPDAFAYMAAFDNIRDWDPTVTAARRLDKGTLRPGSAFEVVIALRGREQRLQYDVVRLDPPHVLALEADAHSYRSYDTISVRPQGDGAVVTYEAVLELQGPARVLSPLFTRAFTRVGNNAARGLRRELHSDD